MKLTDAQKDEYRRLTNQPNKTQFLGDDAVSEPRLPTSNLETSLLRGTEVRELRDEIEGLKRTMARMLPYLQEFEPGDSFEIEAQTNLVAEVQKTLAGLPVETPKPSKQMAISHAQFLRRYLLRQGCEFAQTPDEIALFEAVTFLESLPDETKCSSPSSSDTPESAVEFIVGVAKDTRFSNEYLGNVVRSWLPTLQGFVEETSDLRELHERRAAEKGWPVPEKAGENSPFAPLGQIMDRQRDWEVSNQTRGRGCPGCGVQEGHLHMSWCPSRQNSKTEPK